MVNPARFSLRLSARYDEINPLFEATIQATEEAIINAMVAAETMEGINGNKAYGLPHKLVMDVLKKYNRVK